MTPERWQQIEELYYSVLKQPLAQRAAFLQDCCVGDESLRNEVESLLAQQTTTLEFMEIASLELGGRANGGGLGPRR